MNAFVTSPTIIFPVVPPLPPATTISFNPILAIVVLFVITASSLTFKLILQTLDGLLTLSAIGLPFASVDEAE